MVMRIILFSLMLCVLSACASGPSDDKAPLTMRQSSFGALPGWKEDNFSGISQAFGRSCKRLLKRGSSGFLAKDQRWGSLQDWQERCRIFEGVSNDQKSQKSFFEQHFVPYEIRAGREEEGLFTGYYEASLKGSYKKHGKYQVPVHAKPNDLVMVSLGEFREDLKGRRIAGRVSNGRLKPYEDRADITEGDIASDVLIWVDDAIDKFFLQIQGSGLVRMDDGSTVRVGYDGQNGHPYFAIGRDLIHQGELTKDNVSLQTIRAWLKANPHKAQDVMNKNASYVFFRKLSDEGPIGGEGIPLTPLRSLAVDHSLIPYGVPFWIDVDHPDEDASKLQRMMVAQDTGGAIRGPVRGDVFWGYGPKAEDLAGRMKSEGRYWAILPKTRLRLR